MRRAFGLSLLIGLLFLLAFLQLPRATAAPPAQSPPPIRAGSWVDEAEDLTSPSLEEGPGGTVRPKGGFGEVTSSPRALPYPVNAVALLWWGYVPTGARISLEVRGSPDGTAWGPWIPVEESDIPGPEGSFASETPVVFGQPVRWLQYRATLLPALDGQVPALDRVKVVYIDSAPGAPTLRPKGIPEGAVARPRIISRAEWGANPAYLDWEPECARPKAFVVHHTVTANDDADPAATVRAIYYYHAVVRGWGDIGYNFLVDRFGNLYEGRYGMAQCEPQGETVIGAHAYRFNKGTIGVAFLGTFSRETPTPQALEAATQLIAWKASQYGIDPQGEVFLVDRTLKTISGHRDTKPTTCPGDALYARLPALREDVARSMAGSTWYLAEGATRDFDTWTLLLNPNEVPVEAEVAFFLEGGGVVQRTYTIPPRTRFSLFANQVVPDRYFSTRIRASGPLYVERAMYWDGRDGHDAPAVTALASTWFFPEGRAEDDRGVHTFLLLLNPNGVEARATLTFYPESGPSFTRTYTVPAQSRFTVFANAEGAQGNFGVRVDADLPIAAEEAIYWGWGQAGAALEGLPTLARRWYLAEGATHEPFRTEVALLNPTTATLPVTLTLMLQDGSFRPFTLTLPPESRRTVDLNGLIPDQALSTRVDAPGPIGVARTMFFHEGRAAHASPGTPQLGTEWILPEGSTGYPFDTFVLVMNPNPEPAVITATFYTQAGATRVRTFRMPPTSRLNIFVNQWVPDEPGVSTRIQASLPVVVERSMYRLGGLQGGHNAVGIRVKE